MSNSVSNKSILNSKVKKMSKFKPYDLEEAEQEFPLVNEETLEMLKGGCGECESWREWGVGVYTPGGIRSAGCR